MKFLEDEIIKRGKILPGDVLKVNTFLNHQIDVELIDKLADEWYKHFKDANITKIVTIESSGIALAVLVAKKFNVNVVFAKKGNSSNMLHATTAQVYSYTKNKEFTISIEDGFIKPNDNILIVDDFLANGSACSGLISIIKASKAKIAGICIAIEKGFQEGGKKLREEGYFVDSLAIVESMDSYSKTITFK